MNALMRLLHEPTNEETAERASVAHHFAASLLDTPDRPKTLEEARPNLLLGVRDSFLFEALRLRSRIDGTPAYPPSGFALGSRLWLAAFLDSPDATSAVTAWDLESWGEPWQRCLDHALENLAARSTEGLTPVADGVYHSPWHDCYDPARLLLRDVLAPLELEGDPVAFAPNRNRLLVTGSEDVAGLVGSLRLAMKVVCEEPRPMTALPLVRRGGEWVDLELPRGHVAEPLLRKARVIELQQIYAEQAGLLEKLCARDGRDVLVATYRAGRDATTDAHDSYSVWSKNVCSLLPKTERVVFFDEDQPERKKVVAEVDWPIVALHCAPLMKEEGLTPSRYLVESFPTHSQLEAMRAAQASRAAA